MPTLIDETAIIHESAQIGDDVFIGPYSVIGPNTILKDRVKINPHATVNHSTLDEDVQVYQFAALGEAGNIRGDKDEGGRLHIGAGTTIREHVVIHRGSSRGEDGITKIGADNYIMNAAHLGHDVVMGNSCTIAPYAAIGGHVRIGNTVYVSSGAVIKPFVWVGDCALITGAISVHRDILPFAVVIYHTRESMIVGVDEPLNDRSYVFTANATAMSRSGYSKEAIATARRAYRLVCDMKNTVQDLPALIAKIEGDEGVKRTLIDFIEDPKRPHSICRVPVVATADILQDTN